MDYDCTEQYLNGILRVQLERYGVSVPYAERVINTVRMQMLSCVYHWNEEDFRKALLLIGSDEGVFYKPHADDDIRNFIVVTTRNSEIECLQSANFKTAGLSQELDDNAVKAITSAAIEHFRKMDFSAMQRQMEQPAVDKYYDLSQKHPVSWCALTKLANTKARIADYDRTFTLAAPSINALPLEKETKLIGRGMTSSSIGVSLVSDGFSFSLDTQLRDMLEYCVAERQPFVVDGFKSLTRNIDKLLLIMEYLLRNGTDFVTSNFYLSNGHTERRQKLLRVGRSFDDGVRNWRQTAGLGVRHRDVLNAATSR